MSTLSERDVIGRADVLAAVCHTVAPQAGELRALLIEGEAGIGKTTVWEAGVRAARRAGVAVLLARPVEIEASLGFAGLGDLLEGVIDSRELDLAPVRRDALDAALLRGTSAGPIDIRAVGLAVRDVLAALSSASPTLVAIDDLQWLDVPSARALGFALRRLGSASISFVATVRTAAERSLVAAALEGRVGRMTLAPMSEEELRLILRARDVALPRPLLRRVHATSGGNPFFALELARHAASHADASWTLAFPESLDALTRARLAALPASSHSALLAVSAASAPTRELVAAVCGSDASASLDAALGAGVVVEHGRRIGFSHPLLASALYRGASADVRRAVHRRLADVVDDVEERGKHLALAAVEPNEHVARALELAAARAQARGATDDAASFRERAAELTPPSNAGARLRRATDAAVNRAQSGDFARAHALLGEAVSSAPAGRERARALHYLGRTTWPMDFERAVALQEEALSQADDDALVSAIERTLAGHLTLILDFRRAADHARASLAAARRVGDPVLLAAGLVGVALVDFPLGYGPRLDLLEHAVRLEPHHADGRLQDRPTHVLAGRLRDLGLIDPARDLYARSLRRATELGEEASRERLLNNVCLLECLAGDYGLADRYATEALEVGRELGRSDLAAALARAATVDTYLGRPAAARERLAEAAALLAPATPLPASVVALRTAAGFLALSEGHADAAAEALTEATARLDAGGAQDPSRFRHVPDLIEALTAAGRHGEAKAHAERFAARARASGREAALAASLWCDAVVAAGAGDVDEALRRAGASAARFARLALPFEQARALMLLGSIQRRARRRSEARRTLAGAVRRFEALAAPLWARKAETELARVSGRRAHGTALTASENRIAGLAARGRTNKEIAAELFVTVKTVEGTLSRIYGKLGVRSRTELARVAHESDEPAATRTAKN